MNNIEIWIGIGSIILIGAMIVGSILFMNWSAKHFDEDD